MYIAHKDYPVQKISRTESFTWTIEEAIMNGGPLDADNLVAAHTFTLTALIHSLAAQPISKVLM